MSKEKSGNNARILFVGAPFGPFFAEFATEIERRGGRAWRFVFEGGDWIESPRRTRIRFSGAESEWPGAVAAAIAARGIDTIVAYNDALPRHRVALEIGERLGLQRFVLENGYLRPFWVTLERNGVNGFSRMPRELAFYRDPARLDLKPPAHAAFPSRFRPHVVNTTRHFVYAALLAPLIDFNPRYFGDAVAAQARGYVREYAWRRRNDEAPKIERLRAGKAGGGRFFLCLMQKPGDKQLSVHSDFGGNPDFLDRVLSSFAAEAPSDASLVIKQHPLDYGVERCPEFVERRSAELGLAGRIAYLRKTSIDVVMPLVDAVLTINSTAGLAAIGEGLPVKCLGRAFYDIPGLTFAGPLADFWRDPAPPDPVGVRGLMNYLLTHSQLNGGFHTREGRALLIPKLAGLLAGDGARQRAASPARVRGERTVPALQPSWRRA